MSTPQNITGSPDDLPEPVIVDTESHWFVGDGTLCKGHLGHRDGPECGNGPTAPIHTRHVDRYGPDPRTAPVQPAMTPFRPTRGIPGDRPPGDPTTVPLSEAVDPTPGTHYYGDGCPEHPTLAEGRVIHPTDPIIVPRTGRPASPLTTVTRQVWEELRRAEAKFPDQHLPNGTGKRWDRDIAGLARANCEHVAATGALTWRDVLTEDYFKALAETDPAALRAELVRVAAVAVRWVMDIDLGPDRPTVIPPGSADEVAEGPYPCRSCPQTFPTAAARHAHEDQVPHGRPSQTYASAREIAERALPEATDHVTGG